MRTTDALLTLAVSLVLAGCGPKRFPPRAGTSPGNVEFRVRVPSSREVAVIGSFNGWDAASGPMEDADGDGVFSRHVPLPTGRHRYAFLVDGVVVTPPFAPRLEADDFGGKHGVLVVPQDLMDAL